MEKKERKWTDWTDEEMKLEKDIIDYWAGGELEDSYSKEEREIINECSVLLEKVPCDSEGLSTKQENEFDAIVDSTIAEINELRKQLNLKPKTKKDENYKIILRTTPKN